MKNLSNRSRVPFAHGYLFMDFAFSARNADKGKTAPIFEVENLLRPHPLKPFLGFIRQILNAFILTGSSYDKSLGYRFWNEIMEAVRPRVRVEGFCLDYFAVGWIYYGYVEAAVVSVFIWGNRDDLFVYCYFGEVAGVVRAGRGLYND